MNGPQPYAGLTVEDWPEHYWLKQEDPDAVVVRGVSQRAPAEAAGLKAGDIIETVAGERVAGTSAFWRAVRQHRAGDNMKVTARRGGEVLSLTVALTELPQISAKSTKVRGVTVRQLKPFERGMLGLEQATGLQVVRVDEDSPLAGILKERMNILHVGGKKIGEEILEVADADEFEKMLTKYAAGGVILTMSFGEPNLTEISFPELP
jgi:S1-C subfamily serine protease